MNMASLRYSRMPSYDDFNGTGDTYKSIFTYNRPSGSTASEITTVRADARRSFGNRLVLGLVSVLGFLFFFLTLPVSGWFAFKIVPQDKRLVAFRLGRKRGVLGPGVTFVLPVLDSVVAVNVAPRVFSVPPSRGYTRDGAVIEVGADVTFQVIDPQLSVLTVQDTNAALRTISQTTMLRHLSGMKLSEVQASLMSVNKYMQVELSRAVKQWGISITRVEISAPKLLHMLPEPDALKDIKLVLSALFNGPAGQRHDTTQHGSGGQLVPRQPYSSVASAAGEEPEATDSCSMTAESMLARVSSLLTEEVIQSIDAVYEFELTGRGGGVYYLDLRRGRGMAGRGKPPQCQPDVVISLPACHLQELLTGDVNPLHAYISGQLSVSGDLQVAARLSALAGGAK